MIFNREFGLKAAQAQKWSVALAALAQVARRAPMDLDALSLLAEAAYRTNTPEALGPFQNSYKYPSIAAQMARAFLMLGDRKSCQEFLNYASDSALKAGVKALLELDDNIMQTSENFIQVAKNYPELNYPEYWRALAAVADAVGDEVLTRLAEQKCLAQNFKDPNVHFNQALRMLGKKEFVAGWRLYDFRLVPGAKNPNRTQLAFIPMWEGENIKGKKLLIYLEQGLGDLLFALRYVKPLQEQGMVIEIAARKALLSLVRESFPSLVIHDEDEVPKEEYWQKWVRSQGQSKPDYWVYSLSVPARAGFFQPINTGAYLSVSPQKLSDIQQFLQRENPKKFPIKTINWHGRIDTESDRSRAFTETEFAQVSGILDSPHFVISIQKDATPKELENLRSLVTGAGGMFYDASHQLEDFLATAKWILNSQQLITCDTSVAHLGGALGHPTLVHVRNRAIWQWTVRENHFDETQDIGQSVWYDSAKIQYSLAPKISWMFTVQEKNKLNLQNEGSDPNEQNFDLQPKEKSSSTFRRNFHFAGKN